MSRPTSPGRSIVRTPRWRGPTATVIAIACLMTTWPWSVPSVVAQTPSCTTSWIGPSTGFASFGDGSFWTTGAAPGATDLVCFPATSAGVVFQRVSATVAGWDVEPGGVVTFQGGTVTVTGAADLGGVDLVGSSRFVVGPDSGVGDEEKLRISSGTVDPTVAGLTFSIPESAAVSVDGGAAVFGLDVDNRGTLSSNVVFGSLGLRPGTTLTNSGEILLSGDTTISAEPGSPVARVRNLPGGTIVADGPPFTPLASQGLGDAARLAGVDFQNDGLFHARSGQAVLGSSGVHSGRFVVEAGAQLGLEGASNTFGPGSSVTGGGLVRVAVFVVSSVTTSVVIDGAATFEPAEFHITSGRAVIGGDRTLPVLRFGSGGRLDVNGDARVDGLLAMQPGQTAVLAGSGTLTIPDDAAMTMSGGNALFVRDSLAIVNEGEIRQDGPGMRFEGSSTITNKAQWTITQSADVFLATDGLLRNEGRITIDGPADAQLGFGERSTIDNPGTIELRSGRIDQRTSTVTQLAGRTLTDGTWSVADGATWLFFPAVDAIGAGATVAIGGTGRIDRDAFQRSPALAALGRVDGTLRLTDGAALSTTQPLAVAGSVVLDATSSFTAPAITMAPSATLQTSLGQTAAGTSTAGRLITPAATVAGTLAIRSTDTTAPGRSLVVEAARVTGTFDTIDPDARTAGAIVDLTGAGLEIRLATVAPPPTTSTTTPATTTTTTTTPTTTTTTPTTTSTTTTTTPPTTTTTNPPTTTTTTTPPTTTTTTNPDPVPGVSGQLGELLDRLYAELPRWAQAVDPTDLPVFAGDLAAALGLDELAQLEPPDLSDLIDDAADDLAAVANALEGAGCSIDWVAGVPGQPTPPADGDLIQARCERSVEPEPTPLFDGDDLLDGLATDVTVTADGEFETAVTLRTVVGIDATGPYVLGETGVEAQLGGTVTVTGTAEAADGPTVLTGTVDPDLTTTLTPGDDPERRLRADELSAVSVTPAIDGTIDTTLAFATGPLVLDWNGSWTVATTDGPTGSTVDVSAGTQDVSGSFVSDIGAVEVNGVRDPGGTWTIDSEASTEPSALDGFVLERLAVSAVITPTSISGSGSLDVTVDVAGPDGSTRPFDVATELSFDDDGIDVTGRRLLDDLAIGEPAVVWLQRVELVVDVRVDFAPASASIVVTLDGRSDGTLLPAGRPGRIVIFPTGPLPPAAGIEVGGSLVIEDFVAEVSSDGSFDLMAATATGSAGGVVDLDLVDLEVALRATGAAVVTIGSATGTLPGVEGLSLTIEGISFDSTTASFGFTSVIVETTIDDQLLDLQGVLPFRARVSAVFEDPDNLANVSIVAEGSFDFAPFEGLPFTPVIGLGGRAVTPDSPPEENSFQFSIAIEDGVIRPVDIADITLGFEDLPISDQIEVGAQLRLGGIVDGVPTNTAGGSIAITAGLDEVEGEVETSLDGTITRTATGARIELDGTTTVSATFSGTGIEVEDLELDYDVVVTRAGDDFDIDVRLDELDVGLLTIPIGDLMTFSASTKLNLTPGPGEPIAAFTDIGLSVEFVDLEPLAGWAASVTNFAIGSDLRPYALAGFSVDVDIPEDASTGLPDWLPLTIEQAGLTFPSIVEDLLGEDLPVDGVVRGGIEIVDLLDARVRISGGLNIRIGEGDELFGVDASVDGLEIDLGELAAGRFPITDLQGAGIGVEPFEIAGARIGGSLGLGVVDVGDQQVFYVEVEGVAEIGGIGGGAQLLLTEYGPLLAEISAPLGVPIGPTGVVLAGARGGIRWGGGPAPEPVNPDDPAGLLALPIFDDLGDFEIDPDEIPALVAAAVDRQVLTWETGATLALSGTFTHVAAPGILSGEATVAANIADDGTLDLFGKGDLDIYGFGVGETGIRLSFADPAAPALQFALVSPPTDSPFSLILPTRAEAAAVLDTTGMSDGVALALRAFVDELRAGTLEAGNAYFGQLVDLVAASLEEDRASGGGRPLTIAVLDADANGRVDPGEDQVIAGDLVLDRLVALLPDDDVGASTARVARLVIALQAELAAASAASTIAPPAPESTLGLEALLAAGDDAAAAFVDAVRNASRDAARTFLDVADPRFVLSGSLQPVILGIPFGDPDAEVELTISKAGVGMRVGVSVIELLSAACEGITLGFCSIVTFPIGLVYQDNVVASLELPGTDVLDALVDGTLEEAFDAASVWGVTFEGSVGLLGMGMAELGGLIVPPGNRAFVDQRTQRLDQGLRFDPADASRPVPILETAHYDNLVEFGGLVVTGNLRAPELLVDPVGLFERLDLEPPDDPFEIPAFLATIAQSLGDEVSPGFVQMYVPGDPLAVPAATHIVAEWNVDVLSLPISDGRLSVTGDGAEIVGFFPYFGVQGRVRMERAAIVDGLPVPVSIPDPVGALASLLSGEPSTVTQAADPPVPPAASAFADHFDVDAAGPAPANAYLLALLSGGVYVEAHEPGGFVDGFAADAHELGLRDVTFIENALTDTELVAARSDDATVVVFRGTEPSEPGVDGALVDASFRLRNQPTPAGTVAVHSGFWQAVDSVYDDVVDYVEASGNRRVWLTGHSLGGSLAVVTALRLAADGYDVAGIQSIGAPNVGGPSFTTAYDRLGLGARTQRWVNDRDLVPMLLDPIGDYTEVGSANVFVREPRSATGGEPGDTFEVRLDTDDPAPFVGGFGMDDHDSGLYASRILTLVDPGVAAALPPAPEVTTRLFDTEQELALLHTFGAELDDLVRVLDDAGLAPPAAAQVLVSSGLPGPVAAALLRAVYDLAPDVVAQLLAPIGGLAEVGLAVWQAYVLSRDEIVGLIGDLGATNADVRDLVAAIAAEPSLLFPRVELEVEVSAQSVDRGLEDIGVPARFRIPPERLAGNGLFFRAYTPGFDPEAVDDAGRPDLLRRRGGLQFEARTSIPGLVEEARALFEVTGGTGERGFLPGFRGTVDVDELRPIGGIRVREAAVSIESSPLGAVRVDVVGRADLFGTEMTVEGELDGAGSGFLKLFTDGPIVLGAVRLDGEFEVEIESGRGSLQFDGSVETTSRWLGAASVAASGRISEDGSFDFVLELDRVDLGPVRLSDDPSTPQPFVRLRRSAGGVVTFGFDARLDVPDAGLPLASATGTLDSEGLGSLTTRFGDGANVPLRWGPIEVGGTFRFSRSLVGGVVVSEFAANDARVAFGDLVEQTVPLVRISTDGRFAAELPGATIGVGNRIRVSHGGLLVAVDAGGLDARLTIVDPFVSIPALAERASRFGLPDGRIRAESITIRTADFSVPLVDLRSFELGPVSINGALLLERSGGEFRVRVTGGDDPVSLDIKGFADVEVDPFTIRSDGSFTDINVDVGRIGSPQLAIRDARIEVRKPTAALSSFRVRIVGGQLVLPVGEPFDLPTLTIDATRGFDQLLLTPTLDLGPLLRFTSRNVPGPENPQFPDDRIVWRLVLEGGVVRFELVDAPNPYNEPTVSLLAGSANSTLRQLEIASDGTFAGRIRSSVRLFGRRLAVVNYSISRNAAGIVTLQTVAPAEYNFGFVEADMSGRLDSSGAFDFTGSASVDEGVCPAACVDGRVTMNIRNSGITGTFSGQACFAGVCGGVVGGRVTSSGVVSGTIVVGDLFQPFEIALGGGPGADTLAPTFVQNPLPDLTFRAALPASSNPQGRVNYVLPQATDNRPGTPSVVCTPASGTLFRAGRTPVTCVASDAAGNSRSRSFDVILVNETVPLLAGHLPGEQITVTADDMEPRFPVRVTFFSEPIDVGEFMPAADGTVKVTVTVPPRLTPGRHQLVLTGRSADGNLNSVGFPFTVLDPAAPTPTKPTPPVPPVVGPPVTLADPVVSPFRPAPVQAPAGGLPATGSDGVGRIVVLGAALAVLGLLLWLASRRRLPGRRPHPT